MRMTVNVHAVKCGGVHEQKALWSCVLLKLGSTAPFPFFGIYFRHDTWKWNCLLHHFVPCNIYFHRSKTTSIKKLFLPWKYTLLPWKYVETSTCVGGSGSFHQFPLSEASTTTFGENTSCMCQQENAHNPSHMRTRAPVRCRRMR